MASTSARADAASRGTSPATQTTSEATEAARESSGNVSETRLDAFNDKPSVTAPGDGPADTTDPTERATTVGGNQLAAAKAGHLTVNAAVPANTDDRGQLRGVAISAVLADQGAEGEERTEEYPLVRPNGEVVTVRHNLDTGVTEIR